MWLNILTRDKVTGCIKSCVAFIWTFSVVTEFSKNSTKLIYVFILLIFFNIKNQSYDITHDSTQAVVPVGLRALVWAFNRRFVFIVVVIGDVQQTVKLCENETVWKIVQELLSTVALVSDRHTTSHISHCTMHHISHCYRSHIALL